MSLQAAMRTMQVMLPFGAAVAEMVGSVVARGSPASLQDSGGLRVGRRIEQQRHDGRTYLGAVVKRVTLECEMMRCELA
jgi:hypothetical protein